MGFRLHLQVSCGLNPIYIIFTDPLSRHFWYRGYFLACVSRIRRLSRPLVARTTHNNKPQVIQIHWIPRRDWKRLKGCVFSPPSLCPVPEREGGEKTQPFNRFTSHPGFVCPHIWSISQSSPPSVCMSYVDAPKEGNISSVTDFGCGTGGYVKMISDTGIYARGFDGNPSTGAVSIENV